jgi:hypothetical protein
MLDTIHFPITATKKLYFCFLENKTSKDISILNTLTKHHGVNFMSQNDMVYINVYGKTKLSNHFF